MKSLKYWVVLLVLTCAQANFAMLQVAKHQALKRTYNSKSLKTRPVSKSASLNAPFTSAFAREVADMHEDIATNQGPKIELDIPAVISGFSYPAQLQMDHLFLSRGIDIRTIKQVRLDRGSIIIETKTDSLPKKEILMLEDAADINYTDLEEDRLMHGLTVADKKLDEIIELAESTGQKLEANKQSHMSKWMHKKTAAFIGVCSLIGYGVYVQWKKQSELSKKNNR